MNLYMNNFHGKISEILFPKSGLLRSFRIDNNQLEGPIPQSLVNCKDLELLDFGKNKLNDTFPSWLGNLKNPQILVLRSNRFYGHIANPDVVSSFSHLQIIDLSDNDFNGFLPTKLFENLHAIINGSEKKVLNLSHNSLTGPIPSSLSNLSKLELLDLSSNKLQGRIPAQLVKLDFLQVLNLSCNNLAGLIPRSNHFDTFTNDSYSGNLGLCRFPLSKWCGNNQDLEPPPTKFDDTRRELNWKFSRLMGYACGVVFGLSMGYIVFTTGKPWWFIQIIERVEQKYVGRKIRRSGGRK
ncbi:hypothetical protein CRYUN_Cryun38cG0011900 [Craigia yunnanensis]